MSIILPISSRCRRTFYAAWFDDCTESKWSFLIVLIGSIVAYLKLLYGVSKKVESHVFFILVEGMS